MIGGIEDTAGHVEQRMRDPWKQLAKVSPEAAEMVASAWLTGGLNLF